jgi:8-amino-3,8-dideoxy-alpha-D-manno-octulosonate transaminase
MNDAQKTAMLKLSETTFEASDAVMSKCISTAISLAWTEEQIHEKGAKCLAVIKEALS